MVYENLDLKTVGMTTGITLLLLHTLGVIFKDPLQKNLRTLPRNKTAGIVVLAIDLIWAFWLISTIDLGEFYSLRKFLQVALPIIFFLLIFFVDEFLFVRALGVLLLLLACVLLDAAFLEEPYTRLLLPILAYIWIIKGLFWVGMPFLFRDQVNWVTQKPLRWLLGCTGGMAFSMALIACAFLDY